MGTPHSRNQRRGHGSDGEFSDTSNRITHEADQEIVVIPHDDCDRDGGSDDEFSDDNTSGDDEAFYLPAVRLLHLLGTRHSSSMHYFQEDNPIPTPTAIETTNELYRKVNYDCGEVWRHRPYRKLFWRQLQRDSLSPGMQVSTTVSMLPQHPCLVDVFEARVFCGTYSMDGSIFISSCQNSSIHLYNVTGRKFKKYKTVSARDIGWSILDTSLSSDQHWFLYSTWSPCVHVCNVWCSEEEKHYSLDLRPDNGDRFCAFSSRFSPDGNEIIASASDGYLYVYDRIRCDRILKIDAHQDDANAVDFADKNSDIIYSGGDDGLCKVWDRRNLLESAPTPVGIFAGHKDGITFIDSKGDGRYLISNSKDQTIKLWDIRKFSQKQCIEATMQHVTQQRWDYRWQNVPKKSQQNSMKKLPGDTSVMTYGGHLVKQTLLRCRFSPMFTTGQRYIYTACARGRVVIYDLLTGEIVKMLKSAKCYNNCIRDVSWNPYEPGEVVASSWDGILQMWTYKSRKDYVTDYSPSRFDFW